MQTIEMSDDLLIAGRLVQPTLNRIRSDSGEVRVEPKVMGVLLALDAYPAVYLTKLVVVVLRNNGKEE